MEKKQLNDKNCLIGKTFLFFLQIMKNAFSEFTICSDGCARTSFALVWVAAQP